jgi:hypothetical protein
MNKWYLYQYIYISTSNLLFIFKLHEIINKHVLADVCYYSFEIRMIHVFFKGTNIF